MKVLKIGCAGLLVLWAIGFAINNGILEPRAQRQRAEEKAPRLASPTRNWTVERNRSSFDDSPTVSLQLNADRPVHGWPGKVVIPVLVLRCLEHKTEAYVRTGMAPNVEEGHFREATVRIRLDDDPAMKKLASQSTDSNALFFREPIPFIRLLLKRERMVFGFTPFNSPAVETEFGLDGLNEAIKPLREACGWN